ncbi:hypothetical protein [Microvirga rosea]|uniref:hypothetical protein n=1 Tax=Microvirga rosea TaxID=2715425 RepID=UPI001D0A7523|nr:hypothetical protein [Microvirga rosea]MCB8822019.1 hypothetical protein [Microvirga rosea]
MRLRLGMNVSAPLLYGLSWFLIGVSVLMVALAVATALGVESLPAAAGTDVIAAAICSLLALVFLSLARRLDHRT